jgi:hypothetical protein
MCVCGTLRWPRSNVYYRRASSRFSPRSRRHQIEAQAAEGGGEPHRACYEHTRAMSTVRCADESMVKSMGLGC